MANPNVDPTDPKELLTSVYWAAGGMNQNDDEEIRVQDRELSDAELEGVVCGAAKSAPVVAAKRATRFHPRSSAAVASAPPAPSLPKSFGGSGGCSGVSCGVG